MGISFTSIHAYSEKALNFEDMIFKSFSEKWYTLITDETEPDKLRKLAFSISKRTEAPILFFCVFDSETVFIEFLLNGRRVASHNDDYYVSNKNIYKIPTLVGIENGQKRRLSSIFSCSDTELKIAMLEEYLGVCLLSLAELYSEPEALRRIRSDLLYKNFIEEEKALTGKKAPYKAELVAEYPGKIFYNEFGRNNIGKECCYLYGFSDPFKRDLRPVRFENGRLVEITFDEFNSAQSFKPHTNDPRFIIDYGEPVKVTFSDLAPADYRGKTMKMPCGFYPIEFEGDSLLLTNYRNIAIVENMKIVAKIPVKGDVDKVYDGYLITTSGDSFCGYCYDPKAMIRIYRIVTAV